MNEDDRLLTPEEVDEIESYIQETGGDYDGMLDCIGRIIDEGCQSGRFTYAQVRHDLEIAMLIGFACINLDDYEHSCTAYDWLSGVEDLGKGHGDWYYRTANALMYMGKPNKAFDLLIQSVEEDPSYPWTWLTLGRLHCHYGNIHEAKQAATMGLALCPGNWEFESLIQDIESGCSLEEMELHSTELENEIDFEGSVYDLYMADLGEDSKHAEAVLGIVTDRDNLRRFREIVQPSGFIPDHPFCTFMADCVNGQTMVILGMNEAFLSKLPVDSVKNIVDNIPDLEIRARDRLGVVVIGKPLSCITIDRRLRPTLAFGEVDGGEPTVFCFDSDLSELGENIETGPFVSFVLLGDDQWNPEAIKIHLKEDWNIRCNQSAEGDSLMFPIDGNLATITIFHTPVPDNEATNFAAGNYMWADAVEVTRQHRAHIIVVMFNHSGSATEAAKTHTKIVTSVIRSTNAIGIYQDGTVLQVESYLEVAEVMRKDQLPIEDWIWIGMVRSENGYCAYTLGLHTFGYDELEVLETSNDPRTIHYFLNYISRFILEKDVRFRDNDTIGFDTDIQIPVTRSEGRFVEGMTLKLEIPHINIFNNN